MNLKPKKLIVFDADGVLLDNETGGLKEILKLLGKEKEVKILEEEYQKRKHLGPWGLDKTFLLYKGLDEKMVKNITNYYVSEKLMPGAKK